MNAELIDFTAEALHRRWVHHHDAGDHSEAATLSYLILYYLEGVMQVDWQDGEPYFSLTEHGRSLYDSDLFPVDADDEEQYSTEGVQLGLFSGAFEPEH